MSPEFSFFRFPDSSTSTMSIKRGSNTRFFPVNFVFAESNAFLKTVLILRKNKNFLLGTYEIKCVSILTKAVSKVLWNSFYLYICSTKSWKHVGQKSCDIANVIKNFLSWAKNVFKTQGYFACNNSRKYFSDQMRFVILQKKYCLLLCLQYAFALIIL